MSANGTNIYNSYSVNIYDENGHAYSRIELIDWERNWIELVPMDIVTTINYNIWLKYLVESEINDEYSDCINKWRERLVTWNMG